MLRSVTKRLAATPAAAGTLRAAKTAAAVIFSLGVAFFRWLTGSPKQG
jgi:hypothetical protein